MQEQQLGVAEWAARSAGGPASSAASSSEDFQTTEIINTQHTLKFSDLGLEHHLLGMKHTIANVKSNIANDFTEG